jgi:predicted nucleic acid-binding protein
LTQQVKEAAILMRRQTGLRLPDAIVAATAVVLNMELLTNDHHLLRTAGLRATSLPLKQGK